jgi:hypothetical protein
LPEQILRWNVLFLKAMWHSLRVVATGLFWLMVVMFLLAGITQLGKAPLTGQVTLGFVAVVVLARVLLVPKVLKPPVFNVIGCLAFFAFIAVLMMKGMTGVA